MGLQQFHPELSVWKRLASESLFVFSRSLSRFCRAWYISPPATGWAVGKVVRGNINLARSPAPTSLSPLFACCGLTCFLQAFTPTNEISHGSGNDRGGDGNDSSDNGHDPPGRWCRSRPGEHDAQALSPSRREAGGRPVPPLPSVARPWTACTRSRKDRRNISPARPHSAAGVMGRRSGGGTQLAGAGKTWSREISDRTAPPKRPTSAPGGGKPRSGPGGG